MVVSIFVKNPENLSNSPNYLIFIKKMSEKNQYAENSNKHNVKSDVFTGTDQDINPVTYRPSPD